MGRSWAHGGVRVEVYSVALCFRFGFSDLIQVWHDLNDCWFGREYDGWRHGMTQALGLPLHEVITKSSVINNGWDFMLIICTCTVSVLPTTKKEKENSGNQYHLHELCLHNFSWEFQTGRTRTAKSTIANLRPLVSPGARGVSWTFQTASAS